jgi:hypothetical protein
MTLNQEQLTEALHTALKAANPPCSRFCTSGAEVLDGERYHIWHNGVGRDTDEQYVDSTATLGHSMESLATKRLQPWVEGLHRAGEKFNLNAAMGETWADLPKPNVKAIAEEFRRVEEAAEAAARAVRDVRGPAMTGWPWSGSTDATETIDLLAIARSVIKPEYLRRTDGSAP